MEQQTDIEGIIRNISINADMILLNRHWYDAAPELVKEALYHYPVGTEVKAGVVGNTIKSLVKQDPELIG